MTIEMMREKMMFIVEEYPIEKISLFGSRANGTNRKDSDVDLIIEFNKPISLLTLSSIKIKLEEALKLDVDIIHGPMKETDLIEVDKVVEIYAA